MRQIDVRAFIRIFQQLRQLFSRTLRPVLACISFSLTIAITTICIPKDQLQPTHPAVASTNQPASAPTSSPAPTYQPRPQVPLTESLHPQMPVQEQSGSANTPILAPQAPPAKQVELPNISQPADEYVPVVPPTEPQPRADPPASPAPETPVQQ